MSQPVQNYEVSPLFILRITGFPVEILHRLRSEQLEAAIARFVDAPVDPTVRKDPGHEKVLRAELEAIYDTELEKVRAHLWAWVSDERFRHVLMLSSSTLESFTPKEPVPARKRNVSARKKEYPWVAYIQRLATKSDTISFFGPSAWGAVSTAEASPLRIELSSPAISGRRVYVERWACEGLAQMIGADPEVRQLLRPRISDDLLVEGNRARLLRTGKEIELTPADVELLGLCENRVRVGDFPALNGLDGLISAGVVALEVDLPLSSAPFELLEQEVASWPEGVPRTRWGGRLARIRASVAQVERSEEIEGRRVALAEVTAALSDAGASTSRDSKALYASRLPVNEDCQRATISALIGQPVIEQLSVDLAPWYELWRDLAGLYSTRLYDLLQPIWLELSQRGPVRLPELVVAAEKAGMPLGRAGGLGIPTSLELEIQAAWQQQLGARADQPEVDLQPEDLTFLRRAFRFKRMNTFDWPAPDVTIAARDLRSIERGEWQLVVSEIHPGFSPWLEAFMPWCPDPAALARFQAAGAGPVLEYAHSGLFDSTVHTFTRAAEFLKHWTFSGGLRAKGHPEIRSALVTVDCLDGRLTARGPDGQVLGSLLDHWLIAMGTHRLELVGTGPHSPRLRLGRVVVQRRSWRIQPEDSMRPDFETLGLSKLIAVHRLQKQFALPREVFVRPLMAVQRTHHKDGKPIFCDFRNPLLVEMLADLLARYRSVRVTEMMPSTDECWLADAEGRYAFELRLAVRPRQS